jgi:hypothetical protein
VNVRLCQGIFEIKAKFTLPCAWLLSCSAYALILKMEAVYSFKMLATLYQYTRRHAPDGCTPIIIFNVCGLPLNVERPLCLSRSRLAKQMSVWVAHIRYFPRKLFLVPSLGFPPSRVAQWILPRQCGRHNSLFA